MSLLLRSRDARERPPGSISIKLKKSRERPRNATCDVKELRPPKKTIGDRLMDIHLHLVVGDENSTHDRATCIASLQGLQDSSLKFYFTGKEIVGDLDHSQPIFTAALLCDKQHVNVA